MYPTKVCKIFPVCWNKLKQFLQKIDFGAQLFLARDSRGIYWNSRTTCWLVLNDIWLLLWCKQNRFTRCAGKQSASVPIEVVCLVITTAPSIHVAFLCTKSWVFLYGRFCVSIKSRHLAVYLWTSMQFGRSYKVPQTENESTQNAQFHNLGSYYPPSSWQLGRRMFENWTVFHLSTASDNRPGTRKVVHERRK